MHGLLAQRSTASDQKEENMNTKIKAKINKLGEMINSLLVKVSENEEIYKDVFKLQEKYYSICTLIKKTKSVGDKQGSYLRYLAFIKNGSQKSAK